MDLTVGAIVEGKVTGITKFGAFVALPEIFGQLVLRQSLFRSQLVQNVLCFHRKHLLAKSVAQKRRPDKQRAVAAHAFVKAPRSGRSDEEIALERLERVEHAVHMAALIAVAGVDTGADQAMADVVARAERRFDVGAVMRINVHGVVSALAPGGVDQLADDLVAVRPAGVLGADGDLTLRAAQTVADAAHVHADGFRHACGNGGAAAVADLFIDGHMRVGMARERLFLVAQIFRKAKQNADRELVVQKAALDIAGGGDVGARLCGN